MTNPLPAVAALSSLALGCLSLAGCAATVAGTATPSRPGPLTTDQSLPAVLLSAGDVETAMGSDAMVVTAEVDRPWDDSAHLAGQSAGCPAVAGAAQRASYDGSGWTSLRAQVLREPPAAPDWSHFATQAVVLFPTAAAAADFYTRSIGGWTDCDERELSYAQQPAPEQVWSVGPAVSERDMLTVSRTQRSPQQWSCQRALTVRANVAVDVEACALDGPTDAAAVIARGIGDRLPAA